jgi:hypothetical protein
VVGGHLLADQVAVAEVVVVWLTWLGGPGLEALR